MLTYRRLFTTLTDSVILQMDISTHKYKSRQRKDDSTIISETLPYFQFTIARVVDLWSELDDNAVSVDTTTALKRKLGNLGF